MTRVPDQPASAFETLPVLAGPRPLPESRFLNVHPDVQYVGSERCRQCHPKEHQSYYQTGHRLAFGDIDLDEEPPDGGFDHPLSGRRYRVRRADGQLWHDHWHVRPDGTTVELGSYPMRYAIGSGRFARSYLLERDGFLFESPITWYAQRQAWDMSPGYDEREHHSFHRNVSQECLHCHVGQVKSLEGSQYRSGIGEHAIGCEQCHGPGAVHVDRHIAGRTFHGDIDESIVNPRHLTRELAEAICQNCHLSAEGLAPAWGREIEQFRPGLPLHAFRHDYRLQNDAKGMTVVGHVEQMHMSRCYQGSKSLTCTTCHDPHRSAEQTDGLTHYKATCVACHGDSSCSLPPAERLILAPDDNCIGCHMPATTTDLPHLAFTHHRIGLHSDADLAPKPALPVAAGELIPIHDLSDLTGAERDFSLGLALLDLEEHHPGDPGVAQWRRRAFDSLNAAYQAGLRDPWLDVLLAEFALQTGNLDSTRLLTVQSLADEDEVSVKVRERAVLTLANHGLTTQQWRRAEHYLERLTRLRAVASDWGFLAQTHQQQGNLAAAIAALEHAATIDPAPGSVHRILAILHRAGGNSARSIWHAQLAERLPPLGFPDPRQDP